MRHVFIVSREHPKLFDYLLERFAGDRNVEILIDRRISERRRPTFDGQNPERRRGDRRRLVSYADSLSVRSHLVVTIPD